MNLKEAIATKLSTLPAQEVQKAFKDLSHAYRNHEFHRILGDNNVIFLAYIAGRMPATLAVVERILSEYRELGGHEPKTLLDIGAGPGTASFAALEHFDDLKHITLIEKETRFRTIAIELARLTQTEALVNATWQMQDAASLDTLCQSDLVIASYSLGEMERSKALALASKAFEASTHALIVVEPGTPKGFELVRAIRDDLIAKGAHVAAPCSHAKSCPMHGSDFCHFAHRVERSSHHRDAKSASLPYEDEKYAYVILTKEVLTPFESRIVRRPMRGTGHVTLDLCTDAGIARRVIARSNKDAYKRAKKVEWGDRWNTL